ncbi:hypothetical protein FS837_006488 [Tulasnella sp. UAMH 9824]|nr:hypothetical protein FS837_006488 [Tulasnella sp. UAMH 9824]
MAEQPTAPKTLKLKIRIPALKRDPQPPPPPPSPPPEPELERYDSEDNDEDEDDVASQSPSQSGSPISFEQADDDIETAYDVPSTSTSTQPTFTPTLKLKLSAVSRSTAPQGPNAAEAPVKKPKKPRARPKLFGRVTERKGPAIGPDGQPIFHVKKAPKLKSITEILPRLLARIKKWADFRLMINNCKTFNPAPSLYYTEAVKLETFGNDAISQAAGQLMDPADEPEFPAPMEVEPRATPAPQSQPVSGPPSPVTMTLSGRTVKKVYHERTRSDTIDSYVAPPTPNAGGTGTHTPNASMSFAHGEWQKQQQGQGTKDKGGGGSGWVRGPYKKTVVRDVPAVGPGGELPGSMNGVGEFPVGSEWGKVALALEIRGKRYRTKKERLEMEKRGVPTLWDGSIDYAQLEDPYSVLHHFTPDPFQAPWLQALSEPPANDDSFPIYSSSSKLADRTTELTKRLGTQLPPYFVNRGYTSRASVPAISLDSLDAEGDAASVQKYDLPERWMGPRDFGVLPQIREQAVRQKVAVKAQVEREEVEGLRGESAEEAREGLEYVRDTVYGGTEGLAYARSLMEFVNGASAGAARTRAALNSTEEEEVKPGKEPAKQEEQWEEPPGGLGMSLQDWITQNILQPATGGMHGVLATTADRLRASTSTSTPTPSVPTKPEPTEEEEEQDEKPTFTFTLPDDSTDPIDAQIQRSLHVNPALRTHLEGIVARRKEKINLSTLIRDPADLRATDDAWDPDAAAAGSSSAEPTSTLVPLAFDPKWAERALSVAAGRVEAYARRQEDAGADVKMEVDEDGGAAKENGFVADGEEDEETRRLRFNLLALARVVPFSEGVTFA